MGAWIEIRMLWKIFLKRLKSHPLWVRGLKLEVYKDEYENADVAPFMGAWIEIRIGKENFEDKLGRTLYGCVD